MYTRRKTPNLGVDAHKRRWNRGRRSAAYLGGVGDQSRARDGRGDGIERARFAIQPLRRWG